MVRHRSMTLSRLFFTLAALFSCAVQGDTVEVAGVTRFEAQSPGTGGTRYLVAVLSGSGWKREEIENAIKQARMIFDQCRVVVDVRAIYWLKTAVEFDRLQETHQAEILSVLPHYRPVIGFIKDSRDNDVAYSYLQSAPVPSRGTAWITRAGDPGCVGTIVAHELGHILLDTARHSAGGGNLMSYTCVHSNIARFPAGNNLDEAQCDRLRELQKTTGESRAGFAR